MIRFKKNTEESNQTHSRTERSNIMKNDYKGMWTDNTGNATIKGGGQIEVFKILNGYENIDYNIFSRN